MYYSNWRKYLAKEVSLWSGYKVDIKWILFNMFLELLDSGEGKGRYC